MAKKEVNGEVEAQEATGKKSKKFLIIIIFMIFLLVGGGGLAAYYFLLAPKAPTPEELAAQVAAAAKKKKPEILPVFALKPFVVNLADGRGRRYLKISMKLELSSDDLQEEVEKRQAQIRDVILTLLSSKTSEEINSLEGKFILREEIVKRVNSFLQTGKITKVYFEELVIQ